MTFEEYQKKALPTAIISKDDKRALYTRALGLVGEAGEIAEKVKKIIRDQNDEYSQADADEIVKELGDVLWYIAAMADYFGSDINEVAEINIQKLASRAKRGKIKGSGDNR